jgi:hypothetical protein
MSTTKYYALWYYSFIDGKSTNAISENPESLMPLHEESIKNLDSCYHNYKSFIGEIKVEPIYCYTYNSETKTIEPYNDSHIADDHAFYAFNNVPTLLLEEEEKDYTMFEDILIYLSKTDHSKWIYYSDLYKNFNDQDKNSNEQNNNQNNFIMDSEIPKFFYINWPSLSPVEPDIYYEESIMNA